MKNLSSIESVDDNIVKKRLKRRFVKIIAFALGRKLGVMLCNNDHNFLLMAFIFLVDHLVIILGKSN